MKRTVRTFFLLLLAAVMISAPLGAQAAVKLSKKSVSLKVGKKQTVTLKGAKGSVKWKTSNKKVAAIKAKGKKVTITAKGAGKAKVTAKNKKKTYTCKVKVKSAAKLSASKLTVAVGGSKELKLTGTKNTPKWSVSNKKVLSLTKEGKYKVKLKALKAGNATVTAKVDNKTFRCSVSVADPRIADYNDILTASGAPANFGLIDLDLDGTDELVTLDVTEKQVVCCIYTYYKNKTVLAGTITVDRKEDWLYYDFGYSQGHMTEEYLYKTKEDGENDSIHLDTFYILKDGKLYEKASQKTDGTFYVDGKPVESEEYNKVWDEFNTGLEVIFEKDYLNYYEYADARIVKNTAEMRRAKLGI